MKHTHNFSLITGIIMLLLPLILIISSGVVLPSISAYVDVSPLTFASLLTIGAWSYFRRGFINRKGFFDMVVGLSLFGVVFAHYVDNFALHYTFAAIFFLGNAFNMVYFSNKKHRWYKAIFTSLVVLALSGHFIFNLYSIFWAEWIGLLPMVVNYVLEGFEITD